MTTMRLLVLAAAVCVGVFAFPDEPTVPWNRNTIAAEETWEGGVFENINNDIVDVLYLVRNDEDNPYRLPTTTKPQHYDILWQINMTTFSLVGSASIQLYATQANVNEIVLHADAMNIRSLDLTQGTTTVQPPYTLDSTYQFLRVQHQLEYNAENPVIYTLSIEFDSELRTDMYGIYRTWYRNSYDDTNVSWMASSQFAPTAARFAFPCYDEPSFKASFNVIIRRPIYYRSWFCTRIRETRASTVANYQEDVYETTPVMSTYLLALIVAEYETLVLYENNLLIYEVIGRPGAITAGQGDYAFNVGMELLAEMSNITGLDFYGVHEHIKMTQAAVPDFSFGAMENWGLVTYREPFLMYNESHTDDYYKENIANILAHEIAHMWFGNLVTCEWWDVVWLNEGFARYYQYFLTQEVEDMGFETRFITEQVHTALLADAANNPQPLSTSGIGSPAAILGTFSTISYNKGASVIRMTEHLIGFDTHRQGLRNYLSNKSFQNVQPMDLFLDTENAAVANGALTAYGPNFNFIDYYRSWTEQPGHPVLNVQVNHQTGEMTVYQHRFNINTGYASNNINYIIPITFATESNPDFEDTKPTHIITDSITNINRGSVGDEWIIFNKQQSGFYRVNYDDYTWDLIALALTGPNRTQIHEYNRAQIVDDVFQFARSGLMTYKRAFTILSFLEEETDAAPWLAAISGMTWVRNRFIVADVVGPIFIAWASKVMSELTYYPIENEPFLRSFLRLHLTSTLCEMGSAYCRIEAFAQLRNLLDNGVEVPVNNRLFVYCGGLFGNYEADFHALYDRFLQHNSETEKHLLLRTVGCTGQPAALYRLLDDIVEDNFIIRPQDYNTALSRAVSGSQYNPQTVFRYIQENLDAVRNAFGDIAVPLSYVSARLRTQEQIQAFRQWANESAEYLGDSYDAVYRGAENSEFNLQWSAENYDDIASFYVNGPLLLQTTTAAPVVVTTPVSVTSAPLLELSTPAFPDSAASAVLSIAVLAIAAIGNLL